MVANIGVVFIIKEDLNGIPFLEYIQEKERTPHKLMLSSIKKQNKENINNFKYSKIYRSVALSSKNTT